MSIHDVDLTNANRSSAELHVHNKLLERKADGSTGITQQVDGHSGPYVTTRNGRILVNDGTDNRIILGLLPDGTYNLVISKAGEDVYDALGY